MACVTTLGELASCRHTKPDGAPCSSAEAELQAAMLAEARRMLAEAPVISESVLASVLTSSQRIALACQVRSFKKTKTKTKTKGVIRLRGILGCGGLFGCEVQGLGCLGLG